MADIDVKDFTSSSAKTVKAPLISGKYYPGHILYDEAASEVLGQVGSSPASNTVLGRLKDLLSLIVLAAGTNIIGKVGIDQTTPGTTNKVSIGTDGTVGHGKTIKSVSGSITATTDIVAAVTSKRIKVIAYSVISTGLTAADYIFKSNASTEVWRVAAQAPASGSMFGANLATSAPSFLFATVAGEKLTLTFSTGSDTIKYAVTYFDDDAS